MTVEGATGTPDGVRPTTARIDALDALRGLAVLGIFAVNIIGFSMPSVAFYNPLAFGGDGLVNYGLFSFMEVFVEGSMRGLFSMMFGAGVLLFTARAVYPDGPIRIADLYYRRTLWLLVFGLVHGFVLMMPGDILLIYAFAGLALFPFRILSPRKLVAIAAVVLAVLFISDLQSELSETQTGRLAEQIDARESAGEVISDEEQEILDEWRYEILPPGQNELEEMIADRTAGPVMAYKTAVQDTMDNNSAMGLATWTIDAFMMMLLGMAFYKWRIMTAERSLKFYLTLTAVAYALGLSIRIWMVWSRWDADFSPMLWAPWAFSQPARIIMTVGHIGLFFSLWKICSSTLPMRALTAAGRMALSNYIGQTIIANLIFSGVGLGLYGAVDRAQMYSIMIFVWIAQLAFSMWWLSRYRFGPLEWVWRSLTYGNRQNLRQ